MQDSAGLNTLEILSCLFATAAFFGLISRRRLGLPITIGTMLLTVLASEGLTLAAGIAPGIHSWAAALVHRINFEDVILHGMLPLLLFAGAFLLDLDHLWREKLTVGLLSVVGTALCFLLVAAALAALTGWHVPWIECLLFGALISPTDPVAVLEMLRRVGIPKHIEAQLAGESLFNDGIGAVLFITMLEIARGSTPTPWHVAGLLIVKSGGGILVGIAAAYLASRLMRRVDSYQVDILMTVALALGGYVVADLLRVSAPLEAVVAGIALRHFNRNLPVERIAHNSIDGFWSVLDEIQNSVLFVLLGLEAMAISLNASTFGIGLAAIVSVNAVRLLAVVALLALVRTIQPAHQSSAFILTWGGLRGGLSIALALSVPDALGKAWIVGATYVVVVFSIVLQGGSLDWLLEHGKARKTAA